jgi:hypothetical protein
VAAALAWARVVPVIFRLFMFMLVAAALERRLGVGGLRADMVW